MKISGGWIKRRTFGIEPETASFERLGFHQGDATTVRRLESFGKTFIRGYNLAISIAPLDELARRLDEQVELELRGFAYEGAAMGLALLDRMTPWRASALSAFINGPARAHALVAYIGAGWAFARLRRRNLEHFITRTDPLLAWLALDGYGFHEGFFRTQHYVHQKAEPLHLTPYARRVFDHGLGRSMWFINCAEPERIAAMIAGFPPPRHADLWSGIGLACSYAGGVGRDALLALRGAGAAHLPQMAQGAALGAKERKSAGNMAPQTELACEVLCGMQASRAAQITDEELAAVDAADASAGDEPAFERWRRRMHARLAREQSSTESDLHALH